jgi:hypothetical protein
MPEESGIGGFLGKSTAGLPNWAWGAVIIVGIGAAYFLPKFLGTGQKATDATSTGTDQTSGLGLAVDPTTGLPYAVEGLVPSGGLAGGTGVQGPPGATGTVGPIGPTGPAGTSSPAPGSTFKGPTGVLHYVTTGNETLRDIATKFGAGTWNSIYAIPDNQKLFGAMSSATAAGYKPPSGMVITLPGGSNVSTFTTFLSPAWPGGTTQTRVA